MYCDDVSAAKKYDATTKSYSVGGCKDTYAYCWRNSGTAFMLQGVRVSAYNENAERISDIVDFTNDYFEKWISVALTKSYESVSSTKRIKKLSWYANGKFIYSRSIKETEEKNDIVSTIRYIGNSKDYKEPFGAFCDLRIYFRALSQNEIFEKISSIVTSNEIASTKSGEEIILQFFLSKGNINVLHNLTNQKFLNEEEILHAVKYINKIMIKIESRILFNNYDLIMLLSKYLSDEYSDEVREEVSKYIINIS